MSKLKIGITIGDVNGIGPEIIIKALAHPGMNDYIIPIIYGPSKAIAYHKNIVKDPGFSFVSIRDTKDAAYKRVNVLNVGDENVNIILGKPTEEGGQIAHRSFERACADARDGRIDAIVTAPVNKNAMKMAGHEYVGHTEYLKEFYKAPETVMMMISDAMKTALVTDHVPLKDVTGMVSKGLIIRKLQVLNKSLRQDFGIDKPRIAVLGLNPHAGDEGVIGQEEIEHISPAISEAKKNGVLAMGPYPADGFFGKSLFLKFDAVLAMYHDQGLGPFKLASFHAGVNFTAGLPVIRTSPDHGTAFDIAGLNKADASSMRKAIFAAIDAVRKRKEFIELNGNPLKKEPKSEEEIQE